MPDAAAEFIYNPFILYSKFAFAYRAEGCYTCKRVIMLPRKEVLNMGFFSKMFGSCSDRELKSIYPIVDKIEAMADEYKAMSDAELQAKTPSSRRVCKAAKRSTTSCLRRLPPCARRPAACWGCTPIACSSSAAWCSIRAASPR